MDAGTVRRIKPELTKFLKQFDSYFGRCTTRRYLDLYVAGQLGPLERKSLEPMADAAGEPARNLQQFLGLFKWDQNAVRNQLQRHVAKTQGDAHSVGIIDETSFVKKGNKTAGVQHQYCGAAGKQENCVMSVHLGYARPDGFHCMLDGELYLPKETWHEDRKRCRQAGVPDEYVYRPKWRMALDQLERANANGVKMEWLTFDEAYGQVAQFRRPLEARGQKYVGEVPRSFKVWLQEPKASGKALRVQIRAQPRIQVKNLLEHSLEFFNQPWVTYHIKDGTKGPLVWQAKRMRVWLAGPNETAASGPFHLLVAKNVLNPKEIKFFICNAPESTPIQTLLLVAFSRWHIERVFEDSKSELGMDHFEVRHFLSIQRHLILTCVSHLFLSEFRQRHRGEKPGPDTGAGPHGHDASCAFVDRWKTLLLEAGAGSQLSGTGDSKAQ